MSIVRGWCPSAHRPMMSGDGLLVRVKPRLGWLTATEALQLCELAERFGSGTIDLTSRANLQIRGVAEKDHPALLSGLIAAGLVDPDADREARRNIVLGSSHIGDGPGEDLAQRIEARIDELPELPGKMGIAINLGRTLCDAVPGDFRFESSLEGLVLRADGADLARPVTKDTAVDCLLEMARWFVETGGRGRMARHLTHVSLPVAWQTVKPKATRGTALPSTVVGGSLVGVPFGATSAGQLRDLIDATGARRVGTTPWRLLRLDGPISVSQPGFLTKPDPLLDVSACPGAPACVQATVETRDLATRLARTAGSLHVSGCAKGCARQRPADLTLVGQDGRFSLVRNGCAGDTPEKTGLTEADVLELVG